MKSEEFLSLLLDAEQEKFIQKFGGESLYVPGKIKTGHKLLDVLCEESAKKLSLRFRGDYIHVPMGETVRQYSEQERIPRNQDIFQKRKTGWTISQLVRHFRVSRRQIYVILKNACTVQDKQSSC